MNIQLDYLLQKLLYKFNNSNRFCLVHRYPWSSDNLPKYTDNWNNEIRSWYLRGVNLVIIWSISVFIVFSKDCLPKSKSFSVFRTLLMTPFIAISKENTIRFVNSYKPMLKLKISSRTMGKSAAERWENQQQNDGKMLLYKKVLS